VDLHQQQGEDGLLLPGLAVLLSRLAVLRGLLLSRLAVLLPGLAVL
jgi:hypothetical protein